VPLPASLAPPSPTLTRALSHTLHPPPPTPPPTPNPQCPLCKKSVDLVHGEDPNDTWVRHSATECDPSARPSGKKARCGAPGCKEKLTLTNKTTCTKCRVDVCLR
jgi:hypothetical protein